MHPYRHIIWDWNGTLLNDAWLCLDVMNGLLRRRGMPEMSHARYQEIFDFPVENYYRRLGFDFEKESFEKLGAEFIDEYQRRLPECSLQDGAESVLGELSRADYTQGVLSAYHHDALEQALTNFGVRECFIEVMGLSDIYAGSKLNQGLHMLEDLHVDPAQAVMVGDTLHDHEVARAMGVGCILVPSGNHSRARLETCDAPIVDDLRAVIERLIPEGR